MYERRTDTDRLRQTDKRANKRPDSSRKNQPLYLALLLLRVYKTIRYNMILFAWYADGSKMADIDQSLLHLVKMADIDQSLFHLVKMADTGQSLLRLVKNDLWRTRMSR